MSLIFWDNIKHYSPKFSSNYYSSFSFYKEKIIPWLYWQFSISFPCVQQLCYQILVVITLSKLNRVTNCPPLNQIWVPVNWPCRPGLTRVGSSESPSLGWQAPRTGLEQRGERGLSKITVCSKSIGSNFISSAAKLNFPRISLYLMVASPTAPGLWLVGAAASNLALDPDWSARPPVILCWYNGKSGPLQRLQTVRGDNPDWGELQSWHRPRVERQKSLVIMITFPLLSKPSSLVSLWRSISSG